MVKFEKRHYKNFGCLVFARANLKRTLSGGRVYLHNSFCDRLLDEGQGTGIINQLTSLEIQRRKFTMNY
jgi:hypothetical protein